MEYWRRTSEDRRGPAYSHKASSRDHRMALSEHVAVTTGKNGRAQKEKSGGRNEKQRKNGDKGINA